VSAKVLERQRSLPRNLTRLLDQLKQRWDQLQSTAIATWRRLVPRVRQRRPELVLAALILLVGVVTGFPITTAVAVLMATVGWALLWPPPDGGGIGSLAERGQQAAQDDRLWRRIVDAAPEAAVVLDNNAHILHANQLADTLFGMRRRGGHIASMSRDPELLQAVDQALVSHQAGMVELHGRVPVERRMLVTIAPLDLASAGTGSPALLISFRDLTEQDRLDRMRVDFIANASHELRTPLASLKGFVETLQGAAKDDAQARERFLKVMSEQAERMTRLIDDLLSLSRVEMREHLPPVDRVDVSQAVGHVIQALQPLAAKAGMTIDAQGFEAAANIRGDRDEIVQVFQNLVQNAIKYGKHGGHIGVRLERKPTHLLISVNDDGPGIAPQHLPRLTERFYRVNAAASRETGGTGLGLAIVKHILNRHGGELSIVSKLGHGSTFTVSLPATL
jgi:two-component system, OmpR family, phosphate regulon sensor histidine kinase PhoR